MRNGGAELSQWSNQLTCGACYDQSFLMTLMQCGVGPEAWIFIRRPKLDRRNQNSKSPVMDDALPKAPVGALGGYGAQASASLNLWGPRSPNPRVSDVKGGATRPRECAVLHDVSRARPTVPFRFSTPRGLAEANPSWEGRGESGEKEQEGAGPALGTATTWIHGSLTHSPAGTDSWPWRF